jgi:hypothetical protein
VQRGSINLPARAPSQNGWVRALGVGIGLS